MVLLAWLCDWLRNLNQSQVKPKPAVTGLMPASVLTATLCCAVIQKSSYFGFGFVLLT